MAITCQSFQGSSVAACSALGNDVPIVNAEMSEDSIPNSVRHTALLEFKLVQVLVCYFAVKELQILDVFAASVAHIGIKYMYALYDLLRLVLKVRIDMSNRSRHERLGLCGAFMAHLQYAVTVDHSFIA